MKRIAVAVLVPLLAACQSADFRFHEDSPHYPPPVGTRVILHQPLTIPPGHANVYLQSGQTPGGGANQYQAHCRLEVGRLSDQPQTVMPDEFRIVRATLEYRDYVRNDGPAVARLVRGGRDSGGMTPVAYVTRMKLASARQPEVLALVCGHMSFQPQDRHLTLNEIRAVLGGVFSVQLPQAGG